MAVGIFLAACDATIVASTGELRSLQNAGWLATGYMLTNTAFQPLYGKLSDIFGRKGCLITSYALFAVGLLWCGLAKSMTSLILARTFAGIGGGGMTTLSSITMSDIVPLKDRGVWQGLMNICFASGQAIGAPLGGLLVDTIGWRWAFLLQVPLAVVAIVAVAIALRLPPSARDEETSLSAKIRRIDFGGAFTLIVSVTTLLVALDHGGNISWTDRLTLAMLSTFAIAFITFTFIELRVAAEPFAPKRIIASSNLGPAYLVNFFGLIAASQMFFFIPYYFQAVQGLSPSKTGQWLLPAVASGVSGSLFGGIVIKKTGNYYVITIIGAILQMLGMLLATLTSGANRYQCLEMVRCSSSCYPLRLLLNIIQGVIITTTLIAIIANAGPADQAIATAVSYLFRSLGMVIGTSIGSTLLQDILRSRLTEKLHGKDIDEIITRVRESLAYLDELDPETRRIVVSSYQSALHGPFFFGIGITVLSIASTLFIKRVPLEQPKRTD
ncbi:MFS general substrate transporter [Flagelloscypha sp. PMI_526]|nr:MFS general substrate transporter [Flagelloscypha sp. PMI_526]